VGHEASLRIDAAGAHVAVRYHARMPVRPPPKPSRMLSRTLARVLGCGGGGRSHSACVLTAERDGCPRMANARVPTYFGIRRTFCIQ
jgi:hypothetical protein